MTRRFILTIALLAGALAAADDGALLKQRVQERSAAVDTLRKSGQVREASAGLLIPVGTLDAEQSRTVQAENNDRRTIFQSIAKQSGISPEEVGAMYGERSQVLNTPVSSVVSSCGLKPARPADVARLLQYMKQGIMFASQSKYEEALLEFRPVLNIDKNFLGIHENIGAALLALRRFPDAEAELNAELKLAGCLSELNDRQLASFGYFMEVDEKDPSLRRKAQAAKLKAELPKTKADAHYNLACLYSLEKKKDPAVEQLEAAVHDGYSNTKSLKEDPDLSFVRKSAEFSRILASISDK
jgi:uncharacterized protein YdbL (DUF1318 family)